MEKLRVFETFAGIGAQHKALEILKNNLKDFDYEVVATSEWDIWANISYNAIHHDNKNIATDLSRNEMIDYLNNFTHSYDSKKPIGSGYLEKQDNLTLQLLYSAYKNSNNLGSILDITGQELIDKTSEHKVDMITYSFPCQDLSVAGSFHGFNQGMKKGSGTRSGLLWQIERILKDLNSLGKLPKYLLLENVKNMLSEKHKDDYIEWITFLNTLGYNTKTFILNSGDYGVPQHRERVYALSVRDDQEFSDSYVTSGNIREYKLPEDISQELEIKKELFEVIHDDYNNLIDKAEAAEARPNKTPSRKRMYYDNFLLVTGEKEKVDERIKKRKDLIYQKIKSKYYLNKTRTITTKQDRNPNAGVIDLKNTKLQNVHGKANYRFLSPRETFLLMGFFEIDFDKVKQNEFLKKEILYRQAGNSIVVNVLVAIFNYLVVKQWTK
jgi:DNA (cytosine-5)-methyltransferase 1